MHRSVLPLVRKAFASPAVVGVATAATGFMRQMSIKPYTPTCRRREFGLKDSVASFHACHSPIFKEKGAGSVPTIVIGGFVPDATEQIEFQRSLLREYGSIYYLNYPRNGFSSQIFFAQLADLIEDINGGGKRPVLLGVSFGCGLIARFLQESAEGARGQVRGVVMVSPVLCTEDLIRQEKEKGGGVRMLESNLRRILKAGPVGGDELGKQIERARRCFQALFEAGAANRKLSSRHLSIRKKIMHVIGSTPSTGGYERVLALQEFARPDQSRPIFRGPALTLLAEEEDNLLVPGAPTLALLRDPDGRRGLFPAGHHARVHSSSEKDPVPHASLIFHHHCYNPLIRSWYDRLQSPVLFAAV